MKMCEPAERRSGGRMLARSLAILMIIWFFRPEGGALPGSNLTDAEQRVVSSVHEQVIREVTTRLASPEMEGRGTTQPGGERAAQYIADRFAEMGLRPTEPGGSYLQQIEFNVGQVSPASEFVAGDQPLLYEKEFVVFPMPPAQAGEVRGDLVLVGFGVTSEGLQRDDFAGVEVKGRIVLLFRGNPEGVDAAAWGAESGYFELAAALREKGAAAVVMIRIDPADRPYASYARWAARKRISLGPSATRPGESGMPALLLSEDGARRLFHVCGHDYDKVVRDALKGRHVSRLLGTEARIRVQVDVRSGSGSNVIGVLEGTDPGKKDEAVVFTAHYDAHGVDAKGEIHFGAGDNALGVGILTGIARAVTEANARPLRSLVFIALTAEEHGLLGSRYWVQHPTWPLEKVVANLNFDGIGTETYGPVRAVVAFGYEHSELGSIVENAVSATGAVLIPDPMPEENIFARSDHYIFVREGIPALMLVGAPDVDPAAWLPRAKEWLKTDYHQPSDTVAVDWHWGGPRTMAAIGAVAGLRIADRPLWPAWLSTSHFYRNRKAGSSNE